MNLFYLLSLDVLIFATLTIFVINAPRHVVIKAGTICLMWVTIGVTFATLIHPLSIAKPLAWEVDEIDFGNVDIVATHVVPDVGVFVWIRMAGYDAPRAFSMPYNSGDGDKLGQAKEKAETNGTILRMRPVESSLDRLEMMFYAEPQRPLPPKEVPPPAEVYVPTPPPE